MWRMTWYKRVNNTNSIVHEYKMYLILFFCWQETLVIWDTLDKSHSHAIACKLYKRCKPTMCDELGLKNINK